MTIQLSAKNVVIALLGAAVIGLGTVVAVDHTASAAPSASTAQATSSITPPLRTVMGTAATATGQQRKGMLGQQFAQLFGLTPDQLKTAVANGQTLDQIAGANDQTIKDEILGYLNSKLDQAATKGAIGPSQESSIKQDAADLINQLFAAKLGNLKAGG